MSSVYEAGRNLLDHEIRSTDGYVPLDWNRKERNQHFRDRVGWFHHETRQCVSIIHDWRMAHAYPKVSARIVKDHLRINTDFKTLIIPGAETHNYVINLEYVKEVEGGHFWLIKTTAQHEPSLMEALVDDLVSAMYDEIL